MRRPSIEIPGFVKHMVSVIPDAAAPEHRRETLALGHLVFWNPLVPTLRLTNDELTHLLDVSDSFITVAHPGTLPVAPCP